MKERGLTILLSFVNYVYICFLHRVFFLLFFFFGEDVYEEILEIVSYMTFFSPTISRDMWSLWPLMVEALNDWAIDFFESELFISFLKKN